MFEEASLEKYDQNNSKIVEESVVGCRFSSSSLLQLDFGLKTRKQRLLLSVDLAFGCQFFPYELCM